MKINIFIIFPFLFIFNSIHVISQEQLENPGFEFWEEIGYGPDTLEPVNWSSLKTSDGGDFINDAIPVVWERSTDAHSGMYSVKLINQEILELVAPGTLTNGRVHATLPPSDAYVYTIDSMPEFHTPFSSNPDSLVLWAKYFPEENDIARVIVVLHSDTAKIADTSQTNWIAVANIDVNSTIMDWTRFSAPFVYLNSDVPEYILVAVYAGDAQNSLAGSILYLDDMELIYEPSASNTRKSSSIKIYALKNQVVIDPGDITQSDVSTLEIVDLSGKKLLTKNIPLDKVQHIDHDLQTGVYICTVRNAYYSFSKKIYIRSF